MKLMRGIFFSFQELFGLDPYKLANSFQSYKYYIDFKRLTQKPNRIAVMMGNLNPAEGLKSP